MGKTYRGKMAGAGRKFAVVVSRFNEFITRRLLQGALEQLERHEVREADVDVAWVPGAFEIPVAALKMARSGNYDAVITLGCIIRGGTDHYEHVARSVSVGVEKASVAAGTPIAFGVLTCDTLEQAIDRAGAKLGNKGAEAASVALEMAGLSRALECSSGKK